MSWLLGVLLTNTISLLVLVAAYVYMWRRARQPSMGLWGLGWTVYTLRFLTLAGELLTSRPTPWRFASLAALGLSGFLLWAGTRAFTGRPPAPRTYVWGLLPLVWALVAFLPLRVDYRLPAAPIFAFSAAIDVLTAWALFRYGRAVDRGRAAWGLIAAYLVWAGFKIAPVFVPQSSLAFVVGLLLVNGLALGLAFSLIALSLVAAERHARRRADRLNALAALTGAAGEVLSPERLLAAALREVGRLLEVSDGLAACLLEEYGEGLCPQPVVQQGLSVSPRAREGHVSATGLLCGEAVAAGGLALARRKGTEHTTEGCEATLAIPLIARQQTLGVICAALRPEWPLSEGERRALETLGRQLGTALENAQLFASLTQEKARLELLYRMSQRLSKSLAVHEVAQWALDDICAVVGAVRGIVMVRQPGSDHLELVAVSGYDVESVEELDRRLRLRIGEGLAGWVAANREPALVDDVAADGRWMLVPDVDDWVRSALSVPLVSRDELVGVLSIYGDHEACFREDHRRLAESAAATVAAAVANARLYEDTREALWELEDLSRLRNEVVQNVSHELRTPLTLIQGYTELLLHGDLGSVGPPQLEALAVIQDRTAALTRTVDNLTALRRVPRLTLSVAGVSVHELVGHAIRGHRRQAERAGIRLDTHVPDEMPLVSGDWGQLGLALSHLVDNAIKFSPGGGAVTVRARADERWVHLSVQDQGIGIAPEHLDHIFERFYQADGSTTRRFGGMGVGLALVWDIVEAHDGVVSVESEPGVGSTFTMSLPRVRE